MSGYIPPEQSSRDKVMQRVTMGEWRPSKYDPDELVLWGSSEDDDGVLGVMPDGGQVNEYISGCAYPTGVQVALGQPEPIEERLHGHEDVVAVTASVLVLDLFEYAADVDASA